MEKYRGKTVANVEVRLCILDDVLNVRFTFGFVRIERDIAEVFRVNLLPEEIFVDDVRKILAVIGVLDRQPLLHRRAEIFCNRVIKRKGSGVVRSFPDERRQTVFHELLEAHFNFFRVAFRRLVFDRLVGASVPKLEIDGGCPFVLMRDTVHDDGSPVFHHVFDRVDEVRFVRQAHADPFLGVDVERNDADEKRNTPCRQNIGDVAELIGTLQRVDVFDTDKRRMGLFMLLVEDIVKHIGKEKVAVVFGCRSER